MNIDENSPKFKGYNKLPRWLNKDLFQGKITSNEFALLLIYVMYADWCSSHKYYSATDLSDRFIGKHVEGLDRNKIAKIKKQLIEKKYIKRLKTKDGCEMVHINKFSEYQNKIDWKWKASLIKFEQEIM